MRALSALPIHRLSVLLIMSVCISTLVLASVIRAWQEVGDARRALGDELTSLATLLGNRSSAAIAFDDSRTAEQNLAALRGVPHVVRGCLYGERGELFAAFARTPSLVCPPHGEAQPGIQRLTIGPQSLQVSLPIHMDSQTVASLLVESSLETVHKRLLNQLWMQALVVLAAAMLAFLVALRMQRLISVPIRSLNRVANDIVASRDYRLRADPQGPAELAQLARSFNQLMATIEGQNAELEAARLAALARLARARSAQAVLSALARAPAAGCGDVRALGEQICASALDLFAVDRVSLGLERDADEPTGFCLSLQLPAEGDQDWPGTASESAPGSACSVAAAHWRLSGERHLEVRQVSSDARFSRAQRAELMSHQVGAFLWAAAGTSQPGQLAYLSLEQRADGREWGADEVAMACELADLLALVEQDRRRRRAEASLRDREIYNKLLFQESCMPQAIVDPARMSFVDCNKAALLAFGLADARQLLGREPSSLLPPTEGTAPQLGQAIAQAMAGQRNVLELRLLRHGQPDWDAEIHLHGFSAGPAVLVQLSLIDISARLQAQHELERLNVELEQRVVRRTAALSEANQKLSQTLDSLERAKDELVRNERLASLGVLVAGVAHELNTPIGNGLMLASTLQDRSLRLGEEALSGRLHRSTLDDYVQSARDSCSLLMNSLQRAAELVSRFKQIADDPAGSRCQSFKLTPLLQQLVDSLQLQFSATPHRLTLDVGDDIDLYSRPAALEQALTQLVMNTLVHAHREDRPGCTRIQAGLDPADPQRVSIAVTDDGCGIEPQHLPRIFDPFFTTRMGSGGNGLGLHTVFSLVKKALGGRITADSRPGQGSRFCLEIPLHAPTSPADV